MKLSAKAGNIIDTVILTILLGLITVPNFSGALFFIGGTVAVAALSGLAAFLISKAFSVSKEMLMIEYSVISVFFAVAFEMIAAAFLRESGAIMPLEMISVAIASILWGRFFIGCGSR